MGFCNKDKQQQRNKMDSSCVRPPQLKNCQTFCKIHRSRMVLDQYPLYCIEYKHQLLQRQSREDEEATCGLYSC